MGTDGEALHGVSAEELARLTGVHLTTALRWKRTRRTKRWLHLLVSMCVWGKLAPASRHWAGWFVRGEHLVSPEGWCFTPGEVRAIPFMRAQIQTYQQLQRTIQQADWIEQRFVAPVPQDDDERIGELRRA